MDRVVAVERELQCDIAARRMPDDVRACDAEMLHQQVRVRGVLGQRDLACERGAATTARAMVMHESV
jgi:hypothetical protein